MNKYICKVDHYELVDSAGNIIKVSKKDMLEKVYAGEVKNVTAMSDRLYIKGKVPKVKMLNPNSIILAIQNINIGSRNIEIEGYVIYLPEDEMFDTESLVRYAREKYGRIEVVTENGKAKTFTGVRFDGDKAVSDRIKIHFKDREIFNEFVKNYGISITQSGEYIEIKDYRVSSSYTISLYRQPTEVFKILGNFKVVSYNMYLKYCINKSRFKKK